jgi:hypothetical protein
VCTAPNAFLSVFKWEARKGCDVLVRPASVSAPASVCTAPNAFLSVFKWEARKGYDVLVRPASVSAHACVYSDAKVCE